MICHKTKCGQPPKTAERALRTAPKRLGKTALALTRTIPDVEFGLRFNCGLVAVAPAA
jgi:hypothetical protein